MKPKHWKQMPTEECGNCGGTVEVLSEVPSTDDTEDEVFFMEGEEARCLDCGWTSHVVINDMADSPRAYLDDGDFSNCKLED